MPQSPTNHQHYTTIAEAIEFLSRHIKEQPSLETLAAHLKLSPFYLQRLFSEWAGVSPKKFLQYLSIEHAKTLLRNQNRSLLDTTHELGFSSSSRLHDLFVQIEGMTPGEYKQHGEDLKINYSFTNTNFGPIFIASTHKGICQLSFQSTLNEGLDILKNHFPKAHLQEVRDQHQTHAMNFFIQEQSIEKIKLHLKGTPFQLKVWNALLKIPEGQVATYGQVAQAIQQETAARAVGTAIGKNPIAFLIPCHRVIQATGQTGGYMWGPTRKAAILGWESARTDINSADSL
jgi:AraC family transcriptional regulator of adaptative response/methylated-DNA-[protein]-cysteine methyltransferase